MTEAYCVEAAYLVLINHRAIAEVVETSLAVLANFTEEVECSVRLGILGICEVITWVMHTHAVSSLDLAVLGCRTMGNLARENSDNAFRLEHAYAYEVTVHILALPLYHIISTPSNLACVWMLFK